MRIESASVPELVDRLRRRYDDLCFACGRANPVGLRLDDFSLVGDTVQANFEPSRDYRGTPGVLHGGVAATALDEIMVWAGILVEGVMSVTGTLDLRFRRPVGVERPLEVHGNVVERRGRRVRMRGALLDGGRSAIEATGLYLVSSEVTHLLEDG